MLRITLLGTGPFAVPALRALHASAHEVLCAVSRPPRGRRAQPAPVTVAAEELGIETWTPETVNCDEARDRLSAMEADLLVVCDYGEILKPPTLAVTRSGRHQPAWFAAAQIPRRSASTVGRAEWRCRNRQYSHPDDSRARRGTLPGDSANSHRPQ